MKIRLFGVLLIVAVCVTGCTTRTTVSRSTRSIPEAHTASRLAAPDGLAVDVKGNVYAVSSDEENVQKFDPSGKLLASWGAKDDGHFKSPRSIAVAPNGSIFVANGFMDGSVQRLDETGKSEAKWKLQGDFHPEAKAVATGSNSTVYVLVDMGDFVQKCDASGKLLSQIGSEGTGKGEFVMPRAIAVDAKGDLYVAESGGSFSYQRNGKTISGHAKPRVQKFDKSGKCIASIGEGATGDSDLSMLEAMTVDSAGNIYTLDMNTVKKFDPSGKLLLKWGEMGDKQGELSLAKSLAVDSKGNVYVGDSNNCRIQKFDPSGKFVTEWHMK